jgi:hypothetical protein
MKKSKLNDLDKLKRKVSLSIEKTVQYKLDAFADSVRVNMDILKKKKDEDVAKILEKIKQHIYNM